MNVTNRNEMVVLYDVKDNNPNGDPLSANNRPRIDSRTNQAVVTDVRLKRFIRDALQDLGHNIFIRQPRSDENSVTREGLFEEIMEDSDLNPEDYFEYFIKNAIDVRLFGATFSFSTEKFNQLSSDDTDKFPNQLLGPVQFSHGRSLNEVEIAEESKKLAPVMSTDEDDNAGTFAEDNRIHYGLIKFHGVVNENAADSTHLSRSDIESLDESIWTGLKNNTLTRSKKGHEPRLYARIEYAEDNFQIGTLSEAVSIDKEKSEEELKMRNLDDVVVDMTEFVQDLDDNVDKINSVNMKMSRYLSVSVEGEVYNSEEFTSLLQEKGLEVNDFEF